MYFIEYYTRFIKFFYSIFYIQFVFIRLMWMFPEISVNSCPVTHQTNRRRKSAKNEQEIWDRKGCDVFRVQVDAIQQAQMDDLMAEIKKMANTCRSR